jgi:hypothetical protein
MAEKPLAMDLTTLRRLFEAPQKPGAALVLMHTMCASPELAAVRLALPSSHAITSVARNRRVSLRSFPSHKAATPAT